MTASQFPLTDKPAIWVSFSVNEQVEDRIVGTKPDAVFTLNAEGFWVTVEPAFGVTVKVSVMRSALTGENTVGNTRMYVGLALSRPAPRI